jgi:cell division transport system permease protein
MRRNKKLGSYPGVLIVVSLTVALFLIGFCGWTALTSREIIRYLKQNIEVQVYFEKNLTKSQTDSLQLVISTYPFVLKEKGIPQLRFISKQQAADSFIKDAKEDFRQVLLENPFRDAVSIRIQEKYFGDKNLEEVKEVLSGLDGVYEVEYAKGIIRDFSQNINKIYLFISGIVLIFLVATILLINNTIRLALYSQRFLIRTMQLVGATDGFIQKPYLVRSAFHGFLAGVLSFLCVFGIQQIAVSQIPGLSLVQNYTQLWLISVLLVILGVLLGLASTFQAISKYLIMDLDDLNE